jgi:hypothetical protein
MAPVRYFVADGEKYHPGIPAADMDQDQYDALPKHLQETVDNSPLYRKTRSRKTRRSTPHQRHQ